MDIWTEFNADTRERWRDMACALRRATVRDGLDEVDDPAIL